MAEMEQHTCDMHCAKEGLGWDLGQLHTGIALCPDLPPNLPDFRTQMQLLALGGGGVAAAA